MSDSKHVAVVAKVAPELFNSDTLAKDRILEADILITICGSH